jgi:hypothetical protein
MTKGITPLLAVIASILLAGSALADRIEKTDGRVLEGRIVDESKDALTVESRAGDLMVRQKISKANIRSFKREVREGPGYCIIPIEGTIGVEVTPDALRRALAEAKASGATIVILSIDSQGGYVEARDKLLEVLKEYKNLTFVAHVKQALSSAVVMAMACSKIYMTDRATIGAAVVYRQLPDGSHAAVEAKFRSAYQAAERAAAAMGGYSELWIRGMSESDLELAIIEEGGKPKLVEAGTQWEGEKIIKRKGQILTMTADEARQWGLSTGNAKNLEDIRKALGIEKWHVASDGPSAIMSAQASRIKAKFEDAKERVKEVVELDARAHAVSRRLTAANKEFDRLKATIDREAAPIIAETQNRMAQAQRSRASQAKIAAIEAAGLKQLEPIRLRYQQQFDELRVTIDSAKKELDQIKSRRTELTASLSDFALPK